MWINAPKRMVKNPTNGTQIALVLFCTYFKSLAAAGESYVLLLDGDVDLVGHHARHSQKRGDILFQYQELYICYYLQVREGYLNPFYADLDSLSSNPSEQGTSFFVNGSLEPVLLAVLLVLRERHYTPFVATHINYYAIEPFFLIGIRGSITSRFLPTLSVHRDSIE